MELDTGKKVAGNLMRKHFNKNQKYLEIKLELGIKHKLSK
jgi:hypothetical protein